MQSASPLPYYPRFIFNCSDGRAFSTADVYYLKYIKEAYDEHNYDITRFVPGQKLEISWSDSGDEIRLYQVNRIEIHQLKYDLDEPTYGMNSNDCRVVLGEEKKYMMEIYVFLDALEQ